MTQALEYPSFTICLENNGKRTYLTLAPENAGQACLADCTWMCYDETFKNLQESVGFAFGDSPAKAVQNYFENLNLALEYEFPSCDDLLAFKRRNFL